MCKLVGSRRGRREPVRYVEEAKLCCGRCYGDRGLGGHCRQRERKRGEEGVWEENDSIVIDTAGLRMLRNGGPIRA